MWVIFWRLRIVGGVARWFVAAEQRPATTGRLLTHNINNSCDALWRRFCWRNPEQNDALAAGVADRWLVRQS
jgi:hypothetical protein